MTLAAGLAMGLLLITSYVTLEYKPGPVLRFRPGEGWSWRWREPSRRPLLWRIAALVAIGLYISLFAQPASAAPRHRRHTVCAVAPIEGVGLFRFCPVPARRR
jgi:hypothetical protein